MKPFLRTRHHILAAGAALALAACATMPPPPSDALQAADIAVANADKDRAAEFAPLEMRTAREKLAAAHAEPGAADEKSAPVQRRLADEARADAELATARARSARADAVNQELQKSNDTLRRELQRGSGA